MSAGNNLPSPWCQEGSGGREVIRSGCCLVWGHAWVKAHRCDFARPLFTDPWPVLLYIHIILYIRYIYILENFLKNTFLLYTHFFSLCSYLTFLASSYVKHVNLPVLCKTGPLCKRMCTRLSGWPLWPRSSTLTASLLLTSGVVAMLCYTVIRLRRMEGKKKRKTKL